MLAVILFVSAIIDIISRMTAETPMLPILLENLSSEVKESKEIISQSYFTMLQRQQDSTKYYQPVNVFLEHIRRTRDEFNRQVDCALQLIEDETKQLQELQNVNIDSIKELQNSAAILRNAVLPEDDNPIALAIRSFAAMLPLVSFAIITFCTK